MGSEAQAAPPVSEGRLLREHAAGGGALAPYLAAGGYGALRRTLAAGDPRRAIEILDAAGLRGRAGGGFPTALKWHQVANSPSETKYFVCNAHCGPPGGCKEGFLIRANPHRVLEAVSVAAATVGAGSAFIYLGRELVQEEALLRAALEEAKARGLLGDGTGAPEVVLFRSPGGYITGEETALLETLEGRPGRPRGKPPMPTRSGLRGAPTVINNLETVLQAFFALEHGAERFREEGTRHSSGTLIFCLSGEVERPGLYELPLGTPLGTLVYEHGGGVAGERGLKAVLVGGVAGTVLRPDAMDVPLDYDSVRERGGDLGGGTVVVISDATSMVDVARELAEFFHASSCGKCRPCEDGTARTLRMLNRLDELDEKAVDLDGGERPPSPRKSLLPVLGREAEERAGISFTDNATGLDKIRRLCRWYEHRGDCHHPTEAARAVLSLLDEFAAEFEAARSGERAPAVGDPRGRVLQLDIDSALKIESQRYFETALERAKGARTGG